MTELTGHFAQTLAGIPLSKERSSSLIAAAVTGRTDVRGIAQAAA